MKLRPFKELYDQIESADDPDRELMLTRVKLEVRTWFLRASLALNVGLFSGFVVWVTTKFLI